MRIITGKHRGRKLSFPKCKVRPTQDKVREALFNVIAADIEGKSVLDLFSGSGSLGIEALSRGAKDATFIDDNYNCIRIIKENLKSLNITGEASVFKADVFKAIEKLAKKGKKFDITLIDPPYYKGLSKKTLIKLGRYDILSQNNIIIVEHFKGDDLSLEGGPIHLIKEKRFGDTTLSFYSKQ